MAVNTRLPLVLFLSTLFVHAALAEIVREDLSVDVCAFSIASSGKRCLLETTETKTGELEYQCRSSEVVVERMSGYIETDRCIQACGLDRSSVGISSDSLLEPEFTAKLCSHFASTLAPTSLICTSTWPPERECFWQTFAKGNVQTLIAPWSNL